MKKFIRFIFKLIILVLIGYFVYKNIFIKEIEFTDASGEDNPEVIAEVFAEGISKEDYIEILSQKSDYIKETGKYKEIEYDFDEHYKYSELESIYKNLNNSNIVELEKIGTSTDNRNMYSIEIGKGDKTILFEAGIHAAELANTLFITKFAVDLVNNYENNDEDTVEMLNNYKVVILPSANPDGYDVAVFGVDMLKNKKLFNYVNQDDIDFRYFKANPNGIDLNRNFPTQNAGLYYTKYDLIDSVSYTLTTKRYIYYGGDTLGGESETRAMMYWQNKYVKSTYAFIALHSAGRIIYNGKPNLSDEFNDLCNSCAKIVKKHTGYEVLKLSSEEVGEGNDGSSTDFIAELAAGFNYSSKTGRLSYTSYDSKTEELKYPLCVLTIETMGSYTTNLNTIKREYEYYDLEETFLSLINQ